MLLMRLLNFVFGYRIFECDIRDTEKLIDLFMRCGIIYWDLKQSGDRTRFFVRSRDAAALSSLCASHGIGLYLIGERGLLHILKKYKRRAGVFAGLLFIALSVWWAGRFVWKIEVTGNEKVSAREIIALLDSHGLRVGSYMPALDLDVIKDSALIDSDTLSWMALNVDGTSVGVVVREIEAGGSTDDSPSNLVAASDGVIEMLEVYRGQPTVSVGTAVRRGELLVSGIIANEKTPARYVHASGKIYARTTKLIRVEVPLEYEGKVYTGKLKRERTINFFDKSINLFSNSGNLTGNYDKIEKEEPITFFGRFSVPVSVVTREFSEYTVCTLERDELEAVRLAYAELALRTEDALSEAELVKKTVSAGFKEGAYVIECELGCIENIAAEADFETE